MTEILASVRVSVASIVLWVALPLVIVASPVWMHGIAPNLFKGAFTAIAAGLVGIGAGISLLRTSPEERTRLGTYLLWSVTLVGAFAATSFGGGVSYFEFTGFAMSATSGIALVAALAMGAGAIRSTDESADAVGFIRTVGYAAAAAGVLAVSDMLINHGFGAAFGDSSSMMTLAGLSLILVTGAVLRASPSWGALDVVVMTTLAAIVIVSGNRMLMMTAGLATVLLCLRAYRSRDLYWWVASFVASLLVFIAVASPRLLSPEAARQVTAFDVRPTQAISLSTILSEFSSHKSWMFVGSDTGRYSEIFLSYRPLEVNRSPFWNIDIEAAASLVLTLVALHGGLFVAIALVSVLVALSPALLTYIAGTNESDEHAVFVAAVFSLIWMCLAVPNTVLFAIMTATIAVACSRGARESGARTTLTAATASRAFAGALIAVALVLVAAGTVRTMTLWRYAHAQSLPDTAEGRLQRAEELGMSVRIEAIPELFVMQGDERIYLARTSFESSGSKTDGSLARIAEDIRLAGEVAHAALFRDPKNFRANMLLLKVILLQLRMDRSSQTTAVTTTILASMRETHAPLPFVLAAQIAVLANDGSQAVSTIIRALELKPDLEEATQFNAYLKKGL